MTTTVRSGAALGAGVVVVCGITIGANAFIGAGTVVTREVPPHAFVVGNPARRIGWACTCAERLSDALTCAACGRVFEFLENETGQNGLHEASPVEETPPAIDGLG